MKHEPRPAIYIEKQLGWACKLGRAESLGISKVSQTVLGRLMKSHIWHQLPRSVRGGFRKETTASVHLDARQFIFFLYTTGAFQAANLVLELRGSKFVCGFFKRNFLGF